MEILSLEPVLPTVGNRLNGVDQFFLQNNQLQAELNSAIASDGDKPVTAAHRT